MLKYCEKLYPNELVSSGHTIFDAMENSYFMEWLNSKHEYVILDGGHLPISSIFNETPCVELQKIDKKTISQSLRYGAEGTGASKSQLTSFIDAVILSLYLQKEKKIRVKIHLCLTDTTRFLTPCIRKIIAGLIHSDKDLLIPSEYYEIIKKYNIDINNIYITLQTSNANKFWDYTKKIKKAIKKGIRHKDLFNRYGIIALGIPETNYFGISTPSLLDITTENKILRGDWWYSTDCSISPAQRSSAPLALTKQQPVITLYSYGIKCPATAAGAYLSGNREFRENSVIGEYVAIYNRADDSEIGEKLNRAALLARNIYRDNWNTNIINIIHSNDGVQPELVHINNEEKILIGFDKFSKKLNESLLKAMPNEAFMFCNWGVTSSKGRGINTKIPPSFCKKDTCG